MSGELLSSVIVQATGALLVLAVGAHVIAVLWRARVEISAARKEHSLRLQALEQTLAAATVRRDTEQGVVDGSWSGTRKFRIARKQIEAQDICSFYLVSHDGKALAPFSPGQFLTFSLRLPGRPQPLIRCYSLSDSPFERDHYRVSIKRLGPPPQQPDLPPGLSSNHFHQNLNEDDIVDVKAPGGSFFLDLDQRRPVVLIAGGVGVTPVFSMLKAACAADYGQEIWFFYGVRQGGEHAFREEMEQCEAQHSNVKLRYCYSRPSDEDRANNAFHFDENVSVELFKRVLPSSNYVFYICGPPPMMAGVSEDLAAWGVPEEDIRTEAFGPASVKKTETPPPPAGTEEYSIQFSRSGKTLRWTGGENLLEFAEENGVVMDFGCRAGSCGTCLTAVKSGSVEYLRKPDTQPESGSCLACMARPTSDLVLDA